MSKIEQFENLDIWEEASDIAWEIYKITSVVDDVKHDYGLKGQL